MCEIEIENMPQECEITELVPDSVPNSVPDSVHDSAHDSAHDSVHDPIVRSSLVMDVVACIDMVSRARSTVASDSEAGEALHSVHTQLCALMQSMLSSPLTGRMFAPIPAAIIPYEQQRQSLYEQTRM